MSDAQSASEELELRARRAPFTEDRAKDLWVAVLAKLDEGGGTPRVDRLRRAKAQRLRAAFPDGGFVVTLIAEYLSAMDLQGGGGGNLSSFRDVIAETRDIARQTVALDKRIRSLAGSLIFSNPNESGDEVKDCLETAAREMTDAVLAVRRSVECLNMAERHAPSQRSGADGLIGKLQVAPELALALKLARMWHHADLTLGGGQTDDGLDDVLAHVVEATDPERAPTRYSKWLGNAMKKARYSLSTENDPPRLPE